MGKKNTLKIEIPKNAHILRTRSHGRSSCGAECERLCCHNVTKTVGTIILFYTFSISLTFFNQKFIHHFRFPLSITMTHLITKFVLAALIRAFLFYKTGRRRVTLGWLDYVKRVAPPGITGSLDIGLSNWSFAFITISLYTMTKTTAIVFIFLFSVLFRLEKPLFSSRRRVRLFLMDVEDEADDEPTDTSQVDCRNTSCDPATDDSYSFTNVDDDENKENSLSDTPVEVLL